MILLHLTKLPVCQGRVSSGDVSPYRKGTAPSSGWCYGYLFANKARMLKRKYKLCIHYVLMFFHVISIFTYA